MNKEIYIRCYNEVSRIFDIIAANNPEISARGTEFYILLESALHSSGYYQYYRYEEV